jgi:hypothetical protein
MVAQNETAEGVAERNLGAFGSWVAGDDWAMRSGIAHCCTGNCTRAIYYAWHYAVEH